MSLQIIAAALRAAAQVLEAGAGASAPVVTPALAPTAVTQVATTQAPVTGLTAPALSAAAQSATGETIMALIQPHIGNPAIKEALGVAMRNMGIGALPETQPHQYSALYAAFEQVLAQHGVGAGAPQQTTSII